MRQNLKKRAFLEKSKCLILAQNVKAMTVTEGVTAMANKNEKDKECCYEEMTKGVGGQSEPSEYFNPPLINGYETTRKSFMGDKGFDWSGMEKGKR